MPVYGTISYYKAARSKILKHPLHLQMLKDKQRENNDMAKASIKFREKHIG